MLCLCRCAKQGRRLRPTYSRDVDCVGKTKGRSEGATIVQIFVSGKQRSLPVHDTWRLSLTHQEKHTCGLCLTLA